MLRFLVFGVVGLLLTGLGTVAYLGIDARGTSKILAAAAGT